MGVTYDDKEVHDEQHTSPDGWTTVVLDELDDGRWLATQGGVSVQGHGEPRRMRPPSTAGRFRRRAMSNAGRPELHVECRCLVCTHAFVDSLAGLVGCPRCGSIDEQLGHGIE